MSRRYRVRIRETLRRVVKCRTRFARNWRYWRSCRLRKWPSCSPRSLPTRGFQKRGNQAVRKSEQVEVLVDLTSGEVTVRAADRRTWR